MSSKPTNESIKLYLSSHDIDNNIKVLLITEVANITKTKFDVSVGSDSNHVMYPMLQYGSQIVFGAHAIARFVIYDVLKLEFNERIEDILDIDEFLLQRLLKDKENDLLSKCIKKFDIVNGQSDYKLLGYFLHPSLKVALTCLDNVDPLHREIESIISSLNDIESKYSTVENILISKGILSVDFTNLDWVKEGLMQSLKIIFTFAIKRTFQNLPDGLEIASIARCGNANFGDFQCNNAMSIVKLLKSTPTYKGSTAPKDVADSINRNLPSNAIIESVSSVPNGFINIKLTLTTLIKSIQLTNINGVLPPVIPKQNVLVDFSSPNIAKEMHVGHLRSTIIGDAISRIFEFCQFDVKRVNHVGDWGTQFGMLITYLLEAYPDILTNPPNITDLTAIYKASKVRFDADEVFKETSRLNVVKLQSGDSVCRQIWTLLCDISRAEFQKVYDILDVKLDEVGESYYNPMIPAVIEELQQLDLIYDEEGMKLLKLPHFTIPLILRKSDGGYGYDSTDMAAISYRIRDLKRDWVIVITDAGQAPHFQMIYDAARQANWITTQRTDHIGFGVVCGEDGKRFKTRSSETVRLIDLLTESTVRMKQSLENRQQEGKTSVSSDEIDAASKIIGYGAIKYFDLKQHPQTNYVFNYDKMLDTKGDTAVYLLFAYARLASILRKAKDEKNIDVQSISQSYDTVITLNHPAERALAFELLLFPDMIKSVLVDLLPNKVCDYLKEVSVKFTDFVTKCHVLNAEETISRLLLCEATRRILAKCFELLGIKTLERI